MLLKAARHFLHIFHVSYPVPGTTQQWVLGVWDTKTAACSHHSSKLPTPDINNL